MVSSAQSAANFPIRWAASATGDPRLGLAREEHAVHQRRRIQPEAGAGHHAMVERPALAERGCTAAMPTASGCSRPSVVTGTPGLAGDRSCRTFRQFQQPFGDCGGHAGQPERLRGTHCHGEGGKLAQRRGGLRAELDLVDHPVHGQAC